MSEVPLFQITEIQAFGDPIEGEAHRVRIEHHCPSANIGHETAQLVVAFSRLLSGEQPVSCQTCGGTAQVVKQGGGNIFMGGGK